MKKMILGTLLIVLLVGCGDKKYTKSQKKDLIETAYGWKFEPKEKEDEAKAKLDKITEDLKNKAAKGDKEAEAELEEWKNLLPIQQIRKSANVERW